MGIVEQENQKYTFIPLITYHFDSPPPSSLSALNHLILRVVTTPYTEQ